MSNPTTTEMADYERGLDMVLAAGLPSPFARRGATKRIDRPVHVCHLREDGSSYWRAGRKAGCEHCA